MKLIDVTMEISENIQTYGNRKENVPKITKVREFLSGGVNETKIEYNLHTGTHIDMPMHMIEDGKGTDSFNIENIFGIRVKVLDLEHVVDKIKTSDLEGFEIHDGDFLIFKTSSSLVDGYMTDFVFISKEAAKYLLDHKVSGVGIDSLGIERSQPGHPSHKLLLGSNKIIIEGLRLKNVDQGEYVMYAMPMKIRNVEASSLRVYLVEI